MKKIIFILFVIASVFSFGNLYSKKAYQFSCEGNDSFSENHNPPKGMDEYTYYYVGTNVIETSSTVYFKTYCYDPGVSNCRTDMHGYKINSNDFPYDENGVQIFDQTYLANSLELIEADATFEAQKDSSSTGNKSYNEIHNGYLIYRNVQWIKNADSSYSIVTTIGTNEGL